MGQAQVNLNTLIYSDGAIYDTPLFNLYLDKREKSIYQRIRVQTIAIFQNYVAKPLGSTPYRGPSHDLSFVVNFNTTVSYIKNLKMTQLGNKIMATIIALSLAITVVSFFVLNMPFMFPLGGSLIFLELSVYFMIHVIKRKYERFFFTDTLAKAQRYFHWGPAYRIPYLDVLKTTPVFPRRVIKIAQDIFMAKDEEKREDIVTHLFWGKDHPEIMAYKEEVAKELRQQGFIPV